MKKNLERKKRGCGFKKLITGAVAVAVAVALGATMIPQDALAATADLDTSTKYSQSLGDNASTEYAGRIWTDKSVYATDATFDLYGGGTTTIEINSDDVEDEDFLVAFSALATAESVQGQTQAPVDVVLIIDISGSMSNQNSNMDNDKSRIYNTVQATNNAIDALMALNPYTRVSVVAFSSNAQVLLPLDRYTKGTETEREWIQTGNRPWEGYWEETEVEVPYFTLSRDTASSNYATLYTNAVGTDGTIEKETSVEGGTNIQMGLYEGMQVLAEEESTTANINGSTVQRVPSVILLSDGSPTYSSSSRSWWAPADNYNDGPGSAPYAGNGMKAILVGSYMKDAIDRNYGVTGTAYETTVYTVGMGITGLDDNEKNLAYMTLDPGTYWDNTTVTNSMKTTIKNYWSNYTANNNTGTLNINVGQYVNRNYSDKNYSLTHPTSGYDVDPVNGYDYVDDYYDADNASAVTTVFDEIVSNISITAPQVPTELKGTNPVEDGYITYTDPIGEYLEVKDVKSIIYAGTVFEQKTAVEDAATKTTTYTFAGEVHSPVYGDQNVKDIIITVTEDADGNETLTVKIPASVIPIRVNEVTLNADGTVKTHTNNGAFPARVVYSVGIKDGIKQTSDDNVDYIDASALSANYIANNTNDDGTINFYSNIFTNTNEVNGSSAGDATVEFEPAHNNPFYYIVEDMPIYKDAAFTQQVTAEEGLADGTVYYYKDEYYHGTSVERRAVERTGSQLKATAIKTGDDGYLYRAAGSPRLNRMLEFEGTKVNNSTNTAEDFYAPTFKYAEGGTDPYEGKIVVYLGNNGLLSLPAGGNLQISKDVNAGIGLTAPDKEFTFTLDLDGNKVNGGAYKYIIVDANNDQVSAGTVSKDAPTITLKDGQTATVYSLPPGTTYTVTEASVDGFVAESEGATGTITAGSTSVATFTNTYNVTPVTFPTSGELSGTKELVGRKWTEKDSFTFFITPYNNAPLPEDYDADAGVTVTAPDDTDGQTAAFDFGTIKFSAPGTYRYTIVEKEPENDEYLPGMTYSRALYRLVVTVEDNGDGTLSIASSDIQRLYDDGANPLFTYNNQNEIVMNDGQEAQDAITFTNTYSTEAVTRVPVALKAYTDNSGSNPLVSGMFQFKLEAVGYIVDTGSLVEDITKVPMPEDSLNGVSITENEGHNVTFLPVEFKQNLIPKNADSITFRYKMSEVVPTEKTNGMTYDETVYTIDIVVSIDPTTDILDVEAIYPNEERIVTFNNTYTPVPVTADITGSKTLVGRDMKTGETFEFNIAGANAATNKAVMDGIVVVPATDSKVTVSDGTDGTPVAFAFEDIKFTKAGTYVFALTETKGDAPSVAYDESTITVTVVIDDANKDGNLEVTSITYSNGKTSADFTNTYTTEFEGTPITLEGAKNLTGKSLLDGEFYFNVEEYFNGVKVTEGLVTHMEDTEADASGVYTGAITFLDEVTYSEEGTYEYIITEQIPDSKVVGTTYDESKYRYTVVVEDVEKIGKLTVTSQKLEKADGEDWVDATAVVFDNTYVPNPTTTSIPVMKKVIAGDRSAALKAGDFQFTMTAVSNPNDGMTLPATTTVANDANGNITFGDITFTKAGTYTIAVKEVIPADDKKFAGMTYTTDEITVSYLVTDDRNGNLTATLTQYVGGEIFVNQYNATPAEVTLTLSKVLEGITWAEGNFAFDFEIVVLDPATQEAIAEGAIEFPEDAEGDIVKKTIDAEGETVSGIIKVNKAGTYKFIVREMAGNTPGIHYDSVPCEVTIVATDNSTTAKIETDVTIVKGEETVNDLVFTNKYDASSTELSGHDHLTIEKSFTGRVDNIWLDSDKFVFTLEALETHQPTVDAIEANKADATKGIELTSTELIVSNANKEHPHFGNIIFHDEGVYKFKVTEQEGTIPGVTYDTTPRTITVVVTNDTENGVLVATVDNENSDDLAFNNSYRSESVTLNGKGNLDVMKILNGRDWFVDDVFTFTLEAHNEATIDAVEDGIIELPENATGLELTKDMQEASFGDILFKEPGTYHFVVKEVQDDIAGITFDDHQIVITVTVVHDYETGKLAIETPIDKAPLYFENTYVPTPVDVELSVTKELTGDRTLTADEFEFTITALTDDAPLPEDTTVTNKANGTVSFGAMKYAQEGTYTYVISETKGTAAGVTYDENDVTATVTVVNNKAIGKLETSVVYEKNGEVVDGADFTNSYDTTGEFDFAIHKTLEGREWRTTDSFTFEVTVTDQDTKAAITAGDIVFPTTEGTIDDVVITAESEDYTVVYPNIQINKPGEYSFVVSEVAGNAPGMDYDEVGRIVAVTAEDNGDGTLDISYTVSGKTLSDGKTLEFVNTYDNTSVKLSGEEHLQVVKTFTGRVDDAWAEGEIGDYFSFVLEAYDDATKEAVSGEEPVVEMPDQSVLTIDNSNKLNAYFGNITFHEEGEYAFKVSEVIPEGAVNNIKDGIVYDDAYYIVNVKVVDKDAVLEITNVSYVKVDGDNQIAADAIAFENRYGVEEVDLVGKTYLNVTKVLEGREWMTDDAFTFTLAAYDETTEAAVSEKNIILPENAAGITITNDSSGVANFDDITFKKAGTYKFVITEVNTGLKGMAYDTHEAVITVTVTDDNKGNLVTAVPTDLTALTFKNVYTPEPIPVTLAGEKTLEGRTMNADDVFNFTISAITEDAPMPAVTTVANDAKGVISFGAIQYTTEGTYKYLISEEQGSIPGIAYDNQDVTATVTVVNNTSKGTLEASVVYEKNGASLEGANFTNRYTTNETDKVTIVATKNVTPTEGNTFQLNEGDFIFEIEPAESNPADDPIGEQIVKNATDGVVIFAEATYKQPGTYIYTVHEVDGTREGIIYDDSVYTVTVTVTDDESKAKLVADVAITKDGNKVDAIVFDNGYDPVVATAIVHGHKHLVGGHRDLAEGEFTFTLSAVNEEAKVITPEALTTKNTATGLVMFEELVFEAVGTYEYVMEEATGNLPGVTYDTTDYKVVVVVTDEEGTLKADVTVDGKHYGDEEIAVFNNTYIPAPTATDLIGGIKILDGRPLNDGEFEFMLIDSEGAEVATAANIGGQFHFVGITFDKAGTYSFTIVEKDTAVTGVTYDVDTVYGVTVQVEDKSGKLEVTDITYTKAGEKVTDVVFNNSYKVANEASIQIGAVKTLTGRAQKAGEFTFVLAGEDGTQFIATNGADGSVLFDEINYTEAGIYTYTVTEEKGNDEDVDYDAAVYTVTVTVTDDLKGNLSAAITSIECVKAGKAEVVEAITFVNNYEEPEVPVTPESPKTGDSMGSLGTAVIVLVAGVCACALTMGRRRRA